MNIDIMCANSSQAKGRVERANLTLQDRLVKELRLRGISTLPEANSFAHHFIADFNARFAKAPRRDLDAHRPVRADEDLELIFTWRLQRKVSQSLTLQHERVLYLLEDNPANRKLIHSYLDVYEYPDGRIELRSQGTSVAFQRYDTLPEIDTSPVVENKRLNHALQIALVLQAQRDDRRRSNTPSRTNQGKPPSQTKAVPNKKRARAITAEDLQLAVYAESSVRKERPPLAR